MSTAEMADLRLLLVADNPLARAGLATLVADQPGMSIVGQVASGETLPADLEIYQPDVVVWDLGWEPEENLNLLQELAADTSEGNLRFVVLLAEVDQVPAIASAGVQGLLLRDISAEQLLAAIMAAANDLVVLDPEIIAALLPAGPLEEMAPVEELTPREREVLQLLAEGLANKAIAQRLEISEHTVKFHVNAIMRKLGVQSRTAAVVRATRLGLILL
jgi:two-component system nitrate/nitrite response regulator NarL